MTGYKRRRFFIDEEFQGKYIFKAFLAMMAGSVLFILLIVFFSSNTLSVTYDDYHLRLGTTPSLLMARILGAQWLYIILGGVLISVAALFLSHRVAGPFFRFEKTIDAMTGKDISGRIHLRRKDEGKILAEKINRLGEMLSEELKEMKQAADRIEKCCYEGETADASDFSFTENLALIRRHNGCLLALLGEFKLKGE